MMFCFLFYQETHFEKKTDGNYTITLYPGYYNVLLRGAQGGNGCTDGNPASISGGKGAKLTGKMHITGINDYTITVGSKPSPNCRYKDGPNPGGLYGLGGRSGEDTQPSGHDQGGGGGGYSSIYRPNGDMIIAMVGGGSGASFNTEGEAAGGIGYSYGRDKNTGERVNCTTCWSDSYHKGGQGKDSWYVPGSGGGGGYLGGQGGDWGATHPSTTVGYGGSSYYDGDFWINPEIKDGHKHADGGHGQASIDSVLLCDDGCNDCNENNGHVCTSCLSGFFFFENSCYSKCSDTTVPTYKFGSQCMRCPADCTTCTNGNTCSGCRSNEVLWNGRCMPTRSPKPTPAITPSNTPSSTPSMTPSSTPSSTPLSTPSRTPLSTPSITPLSTPSSTPSTSSSSTPDKTPTDTPSMTQQTTPIDTPVEIHPPEQQTDVIPIPVDTIPVTRKQKDRDGSEKATQKNKIASKSDKLSTGILIAIIVGCIIFIILVALAVILIIGYKKNNQSSDMCSSDGVEETVITDTEATTGVTLDNPIFTSTVNVDSDIFEDDFEENGIEGFFIHGNDL